MRGRRMAWVIGLLLAGEAMAQPMEDKAADLAEPLNDPSSWVTTDDYPPRALRENREGITAFRVEVGIDGSPTRCEVTVTSGSPDLDDATCQLVMKRAWFNAAKGAKGKPTLRSFSSRVRWVNPSYLPSERSFSFQVETDGRFTQCVATINGETADLEDFKKFCESQKIKPFTDANGTPIRKKITQIQILKVEDVTD